MSEETLQAESAAEPLVDPTAIAAVEAAANAAVEAAANAAVEGAVKAAVEPEVVDPLDRFYGAVVNGRFTEVTRNGVLFDFGDDQQALVDRQEFGDFTPTKVGETYKLLIDSRRRGVWTASHHKALALAVWDQFQVLAKSGGTIQGKIIAANDGGLVVDVGARGFVPRSQIDLYKVDELDSYVGQTDTFRVLKFDARSGDVVLSRRALLEDALSEVRSKTLEKLEVGKKYEGTIRRVMPYGAFVDVGGLEGLLHQSNMTWGRESTAALLKAGQTIEVIVLDWDEANNKLSLGRKQLEEDPWEQLSGKYKEGDVVTGKVVSVAKFGVFVELAPGIEGLIHNTELSWTDRGTDAKRITKGQDVEVKIIGIELEDRRLKLSKKRLEESPWAAFAAEHKVGEKLTVKIARIADFGLFCVLTDDLDGLVHANDISWTEKVNLKDTFVPEQDIEVQILSIDAEAGRVGLGIKQLGDDPWTLAAQIASPGKTIEVTVARIADFGAFVTVTPDVEGLIHISQLSNDRVERVEDVVKPGQVLEATVVSFDLERRRIGLSLRADAVVEKVEEEALPVEDEGSSRATLGDILPASLMKGVKPEEAKAKPAKAKKGKKAKASEPETQAEPEAQISEPEAQASEPESKGEAMADEPQVDNAESSPDESAKESE